MNEYKIHKPGNPVWLIHIRILRNIMVFLISGSVCLPVTMSDFKHFKIHCLRKNNTCFLTDGSFVPPGEW